MLTPTMSEHAATPSFRENLVAFRKARGYSQQQPANHSGLSQRMISYYENRPSNPPISTVLALAKALELTVTELIGENKPAHTPIASKLDPRTLRKIMQIGKLPRAERTTIYQTLDGLLRKHELQDHG